MKKSSDIKKEIIQSVDCTDPDLSTIRVRVFSRERRIKIIIK